MRYEKNRIRFLWDDVPKRRGEFVAQVEACRGPRLIIVNTIQTAAVLAEDIALSSGREHVEHLSTALTPEDRELVIRRIKKRLVDKSDNDWTLVATSCVEAGVDFSFRTGFRELSSLLSLIQASGRVNRHGEYGDAEMWSFSLRDDSMLQKNPALETSREVLKGYFRDGREVSPELSTQSMEDELKQDTSCILKMKELMENENLEFKFVNDNFNVIENDSVSVIIDRELVEKVKLGKCTWQQLQRKAVSIRRKRVDMWNAQAIAPDLYQWTREYDSFLGYMRGVLKHC